MMLVYVVVAIGIILLVVGYLVVQKLPRKLVENLDATVPQDRKIELEDNIRRTWSQIYGGIIILLGLFGTAYNLHLTSEGLSSNQEQSIKNLQLAQESLDLNRKVQRTDQYIRAMQQLGGERTEARIGAVYALELIAKESKIDYLKVMEILSAYVRDHCPRLKNGNTNHIKSLVSTNNVPTEIRAIFAVLGRRDMVHLERRINLRNTDLRGMQLIDANLRDIDFGRADLSNSFFKNCDFDNTRFTGSTISNMTLIGPRNLSLNEIRNAIGTENLMIDESIQTKIDSLDREYQKEIQLQREQNKGN